MDWITAGVLEPTSVVVLIILSGMTSFITATMGIGGGALMLAVMASVVPVAALIPVHGLVQLGSNANRALMIRQHIDWTMVRLFAAGAVLGAIVASFVVVQLPLIMIELSVALFILFLIWGPKPKARVMSSAGQIAAGGFTTFLSMFVGASAPLVAGFVHKQNYDKLKTTGTMAACLTFQHSLKVLVFSTIGFAFWQWIPLVSLMILTGAFGTWMGLKLLNKVSTDRFKLMFKIVVTVLACKLLWQALSRLFS